MPGPIVCSGCGAAWGGAGRCHCSGYHQTWSGVTLFDQHRWHRGERDGCWLPTELTTHGQPLVCRDGVWGGPDLTEAQKAARFGSN